MLPLTPSSSTFSLRKYPPLSLRFLHTEIPFKFLLFHLLCCLPPRCLLPFGSISFCLKFPSISQLSCVADAASSSLGYLCPLCCNLNFTFFYVTPNDAKQITLIQSNILESTITPLKSTSIWLNNCLSLLPLLLSLSKMLPLWPGLALT